MNPEIPPRPRWPDIIAVATRDGSRTVPMLARDPRLGDYIGEIEQAADGGFVRPGGATERRLERLAAVHVPIRDCLRLGMTPEAIERGVAGLMFGRTIADVARAHGPRLERAAA